MQETTPTMTPNFREDKVEKFLKSFAQNIVAVIFGLLPIFFIPVAYLPVEYAKTILVIVGILVALIFFSLSILRSGRIQVPKPAALYALWAVAGVVLVSALLSGDLRDALIGDLLGVHTALFVLLLSISASIVVFFGQSKASIMRLYLLLTGSAFLLTIFHIVRLFWGAEITNLALFSSVVSSPIGGWNQLGLFFGLVILLALVALEQLPLTFWGKTLFSVAICLSLIMLAVVNFVAVWSVMALVSLVILMYSLTKDRFRDQLSSHQKSSISVHSIFISICVFVVSLVFIIGGSSIGSTISEKTGINYVEVRPSVEATLDIARATYNENAFVGIGPNRFSDAWRQYKDPSINQTIFWDTNFVAGSGYLPTMFVTTGVFGALAWLLFLIMFVWLGLKMLMQSKSGDRFWYFIASSSFVAAIYLWGMSFVYVTNTTMLLLAAVFTGITFVAYNNLMTERIVQLSVLSNRRSGILLVGFVMLIIVGCSSALYLTAQHYTSVTTFNKALLSVTDGVSVESVETKLAEAYQISRNDIYARRIAEYQIAKMNTLLSVPDPSEEQQRQFQEAAATGINAAQLAIENDKTDPNNYTVLGVLYSLLVSAGINDVAERAGAIFETARGYDPTNPKYYLFEAQLNSRMGEAEKARTAVKKAIDIKSNYTEALSFLTQLDIASGNVEDAIEAAQSIVNLEPNNPARYYQLGVLYSSNDNRKGSIEALERAIAIDPSYANARYFLALNYVEEGRTDEAVAQLEIVRDLNPENQIVQDAIDQLRNNPNPVQSDPVVSAGEVNEPPVVNESGGVVTTNEEPDTSLITPVNAVPQNSQENNTN